MKKKVISLILLITIIGTTITGCGSLENFQSKGGIFEKKGDYIVINYSGGEIFDVWKLKDAYVQNAESSDGYQFTDSKGNFVTVSGDVLVIRCNDDDVWADYEEYHKSNTESKDK